MTVDQLPAAVRCRIVGVTTHLPSRVLTNDELGALYPTWSAEKILEKTGISERRIAADDETALDLGCAAAEKLLAQGIIARDDVDFLLFCTQAPDYFLPTSACIMQDRLGLPKSIGALDFNLGCSGYVYGLAVANGLIASGVCRNVLLVTADTYSKVIHPLDKSVRTLFGDGAAATLVSRVDEGPGCVGPFVFGTDGAGADRLIVKAGGFRLRPSAETGREIADSTGNVRSDDHLFMDGGAVLTFTLREVPRVYRETLALAGCTIDDLDGVVLHQANKFMLDALQKKIGVPDEKFPRAVRTIGNTVSSTIPFVLAGLTDGAQLKRGSRLMLIGFGVGLSWAATIIEL